MKWLHLARPEDIQFSYQVVTMAGDQALTYWQEMLAHVTFRGLTPCIPAIQASPCSPQEPQRGCHCCHFAEEEVALASDSPALGTPNPSLSHL